MRSLGQSCSELLARAEGFPTMNMHDAFMIVT